MESHKYRKRLQSQLSKENKLDAPKKCKWCGIIRHIERECRKKVATMNKNYVNRERKPNHPLSFPSPNLIFIPINIENVRVTALVNSGSNITVLSKSLSQTLGIHKYSVKRLIHTAGNPVIMYEIQTSLKFLIDNDDIIETSGIYISNTEFNNYDCILGILILSKCNATINVKVKCIQVHPQIKQTNLLLKSEKQENKTMKKEFKSAIIQKYSIICAKHDFDIGKGSATAEKQDCFVTPPNPRFCFYNSPYTRCSIKYLVSCMQFLF
uniref:Peptidase A2 domain-containing protein n=1 Tax=Strongyloides stercoralis TaxID=6248 RepID=A0AAF5DHW2_STRER